MKKLFKKIYGWIKPYTSIKMLPIIITVYFFTNVVWYIIAFVPFNFIPSWLSIFAKSYIVFLWLPFTVEKPVIIVISVFIYRLIYREKV